MNNAARRLLLRTVMWVGVPILLVLAGYWYVGPVFGPRIAVKFLENASEGAERGATNQAASQNPEAKPRS
ncbi:MAG: hypothetical protein HND42_07795 [Armatimonadetes bacterium]|nr:hypothetical protein [Armatimonadota bacterium]NOG93126.1 hypothetical protein [Armatimonadota bacterium]